MIVVLKVTGPVSPLLADVADGVEGSGIRISQKKRRETIASLLRIRAQRHAGFGVIETGLARDVLAPEAVVVGLLIHRAGLECMLALNERKIVVVVIDKVLRTVIGRSAPARVTGKPEVQQVLIAIRRIRQAQLVLPVSKQLLIRVVDLVPAVRAAEEVIEDRWREGMIPTCPVDIRPLEIVIVVAVVVKAGQVRETIWSGHDRLAVVTVETRDAVFL